MKCVKCGQEHHPKDRPVKGLVCFRCGEPGHVIFECRQQWFHSNPSITKARSMTTRRIYTMTGTEAK